MKIEEKLEVVITKDQIQKRIKELAKEINQYYGDREYIVVSILTGAIYFLTDLTMNLSKKIIIDHMVISSYFGPNKKTGALKVVLDLNVDIRNKDVLVVEDVVDSGESLKTVLKLLDLKEPKEVRVATFIKKKRKTSFDSKIHYIGFELENKFVIGYGLDYEKNYRNLDYIAYLKGN